MGVIIRDDFVHSRGHGSLNPSDGGAGRGGGGGGGVMTLSMGMIFKILLSLYPSNALSLGGNVCCSIAIARSYDSGEKIRENHNNTLIIIIIW